MAKYKGSWLKGFASTFDPLGGLSWGLQWKEKKAAQKKIDDAVEQFKIDSMELATRFDKARADGTITPQEYGNAMAWAIPLGKEMIGRVNDLYTNYQDMTPDQLKIELDNIDAMFKFSKELDFANLEEMKEFGNKLTQPDAKMQWNLVVKSIEGREKPEEPEVYKTVAEFQAKYGTETPYVFNATAGGYIPKFKETEVKPDLTGAINYLKKFPNPTPEQFNSLRAGAEKYFNVDLSNITQEMLKEMIDEVSNLYDTPEEVLANVKAPKDSKLTVIPKRDTKTGKYYGSFSKETAPKQTPEEEMREYYQKQFGTFKRNLLSGINDLGFIIDPENRDKYLSMTFEEYMQFMQGMIPARFSDEITVTDQNTGKKQKTEGKTLFDRILNKVGLQKVPTEEVGGALGETVSPTEFQPEITGTKVPTTIPEVAPTPKVPIGGKEALIPTMTDKELHDTLMNTDQSDPIYKLLYDEAVKRGLL